MLLAPAIMELLQHVNIVLIALPAWTHDLHLILTETEYGNY
jgi:hypothetical protein